MEESDKPRFGLLLEFKPWFVRDNSEAYPRSSQSLSMRLVDTG